jgi:hypothetical protein
MRLSAIIRIKTGTAFGPAAMIWSIPDVEKSWNRLGESLHICSPLITIPSFDRSNWSGLVVVS